MPICSSNIQVAIRVRPFSNKEIGSSSRIIVELVDSTQINLHNPKLEGNQSIHDHRDRYKQFTFDHCYFSLNPQDENYASQHIIFNDIGMDVLKSFIEGYNTCILCYGQTGTGKTFTMMGNPTTDEMGLTPRICENLFRRIETSNIETSTLCFKTLISYMEIYNEKLRDLLDFESQKLNPLLNNQNLLNTKTSNLKIREHPTKGIYVQNLNQYTVTDLKNTMRYLSKGNQNRSTASTHVHDKSSRSHAIFTITFIQAKVENEIPVEIMSKLHLVDLAGSERASNDLVYNKKQLKEGSNINKSLVSLGNVISILAESTKRANMTNSNLSLSNSTSIGDFSQFSNNNQDSPIQTESKSSTFVPYRDSLLTYLLKDSLGGNSKTHMVANISPAGCCYHETLNTLLFAQRAKKIVNKPKINEDPKTALIKELRQEIFKLKELLSKANNLYQIQSSNNMDNLDFMSNMNINMSGSQLELMLEKNEAKAQELTLTWIDKWNNIDQHSSQINPTSCSPSLRSKKFASGFMVQPDLPYIVALNDDLLSSDIMIYYIKQGETILGNDETLAEIVIKDENLSESHCLFQNFNGIVTLSPFDDSLCIINNTEIKQSTKLSQGDLIVLGKNVFRFNHPEEAAKLREKNQQNSNCKSLKSQSLPSLGRINLSNDGLLMAKFIQLTNNSLRMEEFDIISRSSSFISSKSDFSSNEQHQQARTKNDIKYLNNLKMDLNEAKFVSTGDDDGLINHSTNCNNSDCDAKNLTYKLSLLNKKFHSEQISCKKGYDQELSEFNEAIRLCDLKDDLEFDYDNYFYRFKTIKSTRANNEPEQQLEVNYRNEFVDYIDYFKLNSKLGQLKQKFNFELKFFMNLKNLRLVYMNELNNINNMILSSQNSIITATTSTTTASNISNVPTATTTTPSILNASTNKTTTSNLNEKTNNKVKKSYLPVRITSNLNKKFFNSSKTNTPPTTTTTTTRTLIANNKINDLNSSNLVVTKFSNKSVFSSSLPVINSEAEEKLLNEFSKSSNSASSSSSLSIFTESNIKNLNIINKTVSNELVLNLSNFLQNQDNSNNNKKQFVLSPNSDKKLRVFNYNDELKKDLEININSSLSTISNCDCTACAACILCLSPVENLNLNLDLLNTTTKSNLNLNKCKSCIYNLNQVSAKTRQRSKSTTALEILTDKRLKSYKNEFENKFNNNNIKLASIFKFSNNDNDNTSSYRSNTNISSCSSSICNNNNTKNNISNNKTSSTSSNSNYNTFDCKIKFKNMKRSEKLISSSSLSLSNNSTILKNNKKKLSLKRKLKSLKRLEYYDDRQRLLKFAKFVDNFKPKSPKNNLNFKNFHHKLEINYLSQSDIDFESQSSSSRAHSVESSSTVNLNKKSSNKSLKHLNNSCNSSNNKTKNSTETDCHNHHKHLFPFYFSYNLKDSDDDCLNRKTNNLFKSSMNRIDNTHATFINCLRDWNDPFLHGHKPIKPFGCQRCESCACRSFLSANANSNNSIHRENCMSPNLTCPSQHQHDIELTRHYLNDTHSKLNRNLNRALDFHHINHHNQGFQPIIRCKSSANVPKTIDQCIKLAKSRPRPASIKPHVSRKCTNDSIPSKIRQSKSRFNSSKMSSNSVESDKDSNDTISKDDDFKIIFQSSSPDSSLSQNAIFPKGNETNKSTICINIEENNIKEEEKITDIKMQIKFENNNNDSSNNETNKSNSNNNSNNDQEKLIVKEDNSMNKTSSSKEEEYEEYDCDDEGELLNERINFIDKQNNNGSINKINNNQNDQNEKMTNDRNNISLIENTANLLLSSSTSSLIENDDIVYDDSLQDDSFDSDSLMVDSIATNKNLTANINNNNQPILLNISNEENVNNKNTTTTTTTPLDNLVQENSEIFVLNNNNNSFCSSANLNNMNNNNNNDNDLKDLDNKNIIMSSTCTQRKNDLNDSINFESIESSEIQNDSKRNSKIIPISSPEENKKSIRSTKKRRKSSSDSIEDSVLYHQNIKEKSSELNKITNFLNKNSPTRSYSESYLNENDTDIDQDDCSNYDEISLINNLNNINNIKNTTSTNNNTDLIDLFEDNTSKFIFDTTNNENELNLIFKSKQAFLNQKNILSLYKIVLEQTDLDQWDNTALIDEWNESSKITISSQKPLSVITKETNKRNTNNFELLNNLSLSRSEYWSNKDYEKPIMDENNINKRDDNSINEELSASDIGYASNSNQTNPAFNETNTQNLPKVLSPSASCDKYKVLERQPSSPSSELENQMKFYDRVKETFYLELDKTMINTENNKYNLTPPTSQSSSPNRRRSTSNERKFFAQSSITSMVSENDLESNCEQSKILYKYPGDAVGGEHYLDNQKSPPSCRLSRSSSISKKSIDEDILETKKILYSSMANDAELKNESSELNDILDLPTIIVHESRPIISTSEFSNQSNVTLNNESDLTKVTSLFDSFPSEISTGSSSLNKESTKSLLSENVNIFEKNTNEEEQSSSSQFQKSIIFEDYNPNNNNNNSHNNNDNHINNTSCSHDNSVSSSEINNNFNANVKEEILIKTEDLIKSIIDGSLIQETKIDLEVKLNKENKMEIDLNNSNDDNTNYNEMVPDEELSLHTLKLSSSKNFSNPDLTKYQEIENESLKRHNFQLTSHEDLKSSSVDSTSSIDNKLDMKINKSKSKIPSFFNNLSPLRKKQKMQNEDTIEPSATWLISSKIHCSTDEREKTYRSLSNPSGSTIKAHLNDELKSYSEKHDDVDEDDEFFLAISSSGLETGSCPEFYWYPVIPFGAAITNSGTNFDMLASFSISKKKRSKSENDLYSSTFKSYENITHNNYVQMINSMINGAISEAADPEYVEYLKRHIQGLFDNYTPVLLKSKSNEEMAITSPSRDKIIEIINQSIPKSFSLDFKLLEESKLNQSEDVMDFSKFGLGIKDQKDDSQNDNLQFSSNEMIKSIDDLDKSFVQSESETFLNQDNHDSNYEKNTNEQVEQVLNEILDKLSNSSEQNLNENKNEEEKNLDFKLNELKSSTKINFGSIDDLKTIDNNENNQSGDGLNKNFQSFLGQSSNEHTSNSLQHSSYINSGNDDSNEISSTQVRSESTASTIVNVKSKCLSLLGETVDDESVEIENENDSSWSKNSTPSGHTSTSSTKSDSESNTISTPVTSVQEIVLVDKTDSPNSPPSSPVDKLPLNVDTLINESVVIDEFEYHYKEDLESNLNVEENLNENNKDQINNRQRTSSSSSTESPSSPSMDAGLSNVKLSQSNLITEEIVEREENKKQNDENIDIITEPVATFLVAKAEVIELDTSKESLSSQRISSFSSSSSTTSNDWLDVQKAINEYQKLNLDESHSENESENGNQIKNENDTLNVEKKSFYDVNESIEEKEPLFSPAGFETIKPIELNKPNDSTSSILISGGESSPRRNSSSDNETCDNSTKELIHDSSKDESFDQDKEKKANVTPDSIDDVLIECKIDYKLKDEDESSTSDSDSSMNSDKRASDYDNLYILNPDKKLNSSTQAIISLSSVQNDSSTSLVDYDKDEMNALSTSINSVNSAESGSNQNLVNETFASFTSITSNEPFLNKSIDDENEDDENEGAEYNFVEDFTDLSKELEENWIQEDEMWFNNLVNLAKPLAAINSIHPPRILHRIDEEGSLSSDSDAKMNSVEQETNLEPEKQTHQEDKINLEIKGTENISENEILIKGSGEFKDFLTNVEQFKVTFEYSFKKDQIIDEIQSKNSKEKLRTQQCNIDSLLGVSAPIVPNEASDNQENILFHKPSFNLLEQNLTSTRIDETICDSTSNETDNKLIDLTANKLEQTEIDASNLNNLNKENEKDLPVCNSKRLLSQHEASTENDASDFESEEYLPLNISRVNEERLEIFEVENSEEKESSENYSKTTVIEFEIIDSNKQNENNKNKSAQEAKESSLSLDSDEPETIVSEMSDFNELKKDENIVFESNQTDKVVLDDFSDIQSESQELTDLDNESKALIEELIEKVENHENQIKNLKSNIINEKEMETESEKSIENDFSVQGLVNFDTIGNEELNKVESNNVIVKEYSNQEYLLESFKPDFDSVLLPRDSITDPDNFIDFSESSKSLDLEFVNNTSDTEFKINTEKEVQDFIEARNELFEIEQQLLKKFAEIENENSQDFLLDSSIDKDKQNEMFNNFEIHDVINRPIIEEDETENLEVNENEIKNKENEPIKQQLKSESDDEIHYENEIIEYVITKIENDNQIQILEESKSEHVSRESEFQIESEIENQEKTNDNLSNENDDEKNFQSKAEEISSSSEDESNVLSEVEVKYKRSQEKLNYQIETLGSDSDEDISNKDSSDVISEVEVKYKKSLEDINSDIDSFIDSDIDDKDKKVVIEELVENDLTVETKDNDLAKDEKIETSEEILCEGIVIQNDNSVHALVKDKSGKLELEIELGQTEDEDEQIIQQSVESQVEYKFIDNENFQEIDNENLPYHREEMFNYEEVNESSIKKAESELDISKLQLNLTESEEDSISSDKLKEVISDIEKEIEEKSPISSPKQELQDENSILTVEENIKIFTKNKNNEITESLINGTDIKYIIRPNTLSINEYNQTPRELLTQQHGTIDFIDNDEERDEFHKNTQEESKLIESFTWPLISNNKSYEVKIDKSSENEKEKMSSIITSDRIQDLEQKYFIPSKVYVSSSTCTDESNFYENHQDKSYQVNPNDLPGNMVDCHTQITPPISPVKKATNITNESSSVNKITKVSVSTETDEPELFNNKLISDEEELLRKKLIEKENSLRLTSIATQTLSNDIEDKESEKLVIEHLEPKQIEPVKVSWNSLEKELNLEEINKINNQKPEIIVVDNNTSLLKVDEGKKVDEEIKLEVEKVVKDDEKIKKTSPVANNSTKKETEKSDNLKLNIRQKIKIQNLDSYLDKSSKTNNNNYQLDDDSNEFYNLPSSLNQIKATKIPDTVKIQPSVNQVDKNDSLIKNQDLQLDNLNTSRTSNNVPVQTEARSRSISNSSNLIDLLSLNLDRSKTWVEMTEAKLNYMIGETDAVLRSMHLDSSDDETNKKGTNMKNLTIDTNTQEEANRSQNPHFHHHHYHHYISPNQSLNGSYNSQSPNLISPDHNLSCLTSTNKTIEEMTQLYLDNYKRQLEDSRKELSTKMTLLEKEKEKVAKIRDVRKRELYMRRQAAIEAFKLEREREIRNAQFAKLDEVRTKIDTSNCSDYRNDVYNDEYEFKNDSSVNMIDDYVDEDMDLNRTLLSTTSSGRGRTRKRFNEQLPSQNREKLAKLRRNVVLSSTGHYPNNNPNVSYYEDCLINTPRSCVSSNGSEYYKTGQSSTDANKTRNNSRTRSQVEPITTTTTSTTRQTSTITTTRTSSLTTHYNNQTSNSTNGNEQNNNFLASPMGISIPVRNANNSYSSTPKSTNQSEDKSRKNYDQQSKQYQYEWSKQQPDSRLLIPVQTNYSSTIETRIGQTTSTSSNSSSIIDESRLLLKEYEQLRNDSVSEIQRAHDSLNASEPSTKQSDKKSVNEKSSNENVDCEHCNHLKTKHHQQPCTRHCTRHQRSQFQTIPQLRLMESTVEKAVERLVEMSHPFRINMLKGESYHQSQNLERSKKDTCSASTTHRQTRRHRTQIPIEKRSQFQSIHRCPHHLLYQVQPDTVDKEPPKASLTQPTPHSVRLELIKCQNRIQHRSLSPIIREIRPAQLTAINMTNIKEHQNYQLKSVPNSSSKTFRTVMKTKYANENENSKNKSIRLNINNLNTDCHFCFGFIDNQKDENKKVLDKNIPIYF